MPKQWTMSFSVASSPVSSPRSRPSLKKSSSKKTTWRTSRSTSKSLKSTWLTSLSCRPKVNRWPLSFSSNLSRSLRKKWTSSLSSNMSSSVSNSLRMSSVLSLNTWKIHWIQLVLWIWEVNMMLSILRPPGSPLDLFQLCMDLSTRDLSTTLETLTDFLRDKTLLLNLLFQLPIWLIWTSCSFENGAICYWFSNLIWFGWFRADK